MQTSHLTVHRHRTDLGFTLIEMVASLVLLSVLVAVFGMGLATAIEGYDFARNNATISQKGAIAMTRMARELGELTDIKAVNNSKNNPYIIYERVRASEVPARILFVLRLDSTTGTIYFHEDWQGDLSFDNPRGYPLVDGVAPLVDDDAGFTLKFYHDGTGTPMDWSEDSDISSLDTVQITLNLVRPERADRTQQFITRVDTPYAGQ